MSRGHRVVHGPVVRLLCVACVTAGGLSCLGFVAALPVLLSDDDVTPENWVAWWGDWLPVAMILAGAGLVQLAIAGWGVWAWPSAEEAG